MKHSEEEINSIIHKYHFYNEDMIIDSKLVPKYITLSSGKKVKDDEEPVFYLKKCATNIGIVLEHKHPNCIAYNVFDDAIEFNGSKIFNEQIIAFKMEAEQAFQSDINIKMVNEAITHVAHKNKYNPLKNILDALPETDTHYLDNWLVLLFGAPDTQLNRVYGKKWMMAAVARAVEPRECYVEAALVLYGGQAAFKTYFFKNINLDPKYYCGSKVDLSDTRRLANTYKGKHIIELNELTQFSKMDENDIKQFITQTSDTYDPKYENQSKTSRRWMIFGGSTNRNDFLTDNTGSRRFWVVNVDKLDADLLLKIKDALWKEAYEAYKSADRTGVRDPWVLTDEEIKMCNEANKAFSSTDIVYSYVYDFLAETESRDIRAHEINDYLKNRCTGYTAKIVSDLMQNKFKWEKKDKKDGAHYIANADSIMPTRENTEVPSNVRVKEEFEDKTEYPLDLSTVYKKKMSLT